MPAEQARIRLPREAMDSIPKGQSLSQRNGRATVSLRRPSDGEIEVTANCDSLNRQLLIYEQAYAQLLEVYVACTDSLRTSIESYKKAERKKPPNWVVVLVILLMGILIGGAAVGVRKP